jgi:hypothetical protein
VRVRIDAGGPGIEELAPTSTVGKLVSIVKQQVGIHSVVKKELASYVSPALTNYELREAPSVKVEVDHAYEESRGVFWKGKDGLGDLPEDTLGRTELRLLKRSVETKSQSTAA